MSDVLYDRLQSACMAMVVVSALVSDKVQGGAGLALAMGVAAALLGAGLYVRRHAALDA